MFLIVILVLFFAAGLNMGATGKEAVNFNPVRPRRAKATADAAPREGAAGREGRPGRAGEHGADAKTVATVDNNNINLALDGDQNATSSAFEQVAEGSPEAGDASTGTSSPWCWRNAPTGWPSACCRSRP